MLKPSESAPKNLASVTATVAKAGMSKSSTSNRMAVSAATKEWVTIQEDIFSPDGSVLVAKAGQRIPVELLPKLRKLGETRFGQFSIEIEVEPTELVDPPQENHASNLRMTRQSMNPMSQPAPLKPKEGQKALNVLVYEPVSSMRKRLEQCLTLCGLPSNNLQSFLLPELLDFALEKYNPDVFVVDASLLDNVPDADGIMALKERSGCKQLIVTLDVQKYTPDMQEAILQSWEPIDHLPGVRVLLKPINRLFLREVLQNIR